MGYIYKITNTITSKSYIGQTKQNNVEYRWKDHKASMITGKNGCPLLINTSKRYGVDSFIFDVIIICFDEDLDRYEEEYISIYNTLYPNGYNMLTGGNDTRGFTGKKHSEETKQKLREIGLNKDSKRKQKREKYKGLDSKSIRQLNANTYYGIDENRKKLSEIMTKINGRKIDQYSLNNTFIESYNSIREASKRINISEKGIQRCCSNKIKTYEGYIWKYHI